MGAQAMNADHADCDACHCIPSHEGTCAYVVATSVALRGPRFLAIREILGSVSLEHPRVFTIPMTP